MKVFHGSYMAVNKTDLTKNRDNETARILVVNLVWYYV